MNKINKITVTHNERFYTSTTEVYFDGAVYRYCTNDRIPPAHAIREYGIDKLPHFDLAKHDEARDSELHAFLEEYRENMKNWVPSGEELFEMRAAFGEGAVVQNAITGQKWRI